MVMAKRLDVGGRDVHDTRTVDLEEAIKASKDAGKAKRPRGRPRVVRTPEEQEEAKRIAAIHKKERQERWKRGVEDEQDAVAGFLRSVYYGDLSRLRYGEPPVLLAYTDIALLRYVRRLIIASNKTTVRVNARRPGEEPYALTPLGPLEEAIVTRWMWERECERQEMASQDAEKNGGAA